MMWRYLMGYLLCLGLLLLSGNLFGEPFLKLPWVSSSFSLSSISCWLSFLLAIRLESFSYSSRPSYDYCSKPSYLPPFLPTLWLSSGSKSLIIFLIMSQCSSILVSFPNKNLLNSYKNYSPSYSHSNTMPASVNVYRCRIDSALYKQSLLIGVFSFIHWNRTPGSYLLLFKSVYVIIFADTFVYNVVIARFRIYCNGLCIFAISPYITFVLLYIFTLFILLTSNSASFVFILDKYF